MKIKITATFLGVILLTLPASVGAFSFIENVQDFGVDAAGYNYVSTVDFSDGLTMFGHTGSWHHSLSNEYQIGSGSYSIASAVLHVEGWQYMGYGGEFLSAGGTGTFTPLHDWRSLNYSYASLDLTHIAGSYWNQDQLYASLTPLLELGVNLNRATLCIDYDRASETLATPEPATLVLMGFGLVGGGLLKRRKKRS